MADKSFGVKELNLISASGTPTITSPNSVNINATNVAISTDITVGGMVSLGAGTSISSPGTNVLTFGTNSTEKVRITSDGNIGIGDNAPSQKLNVGGNIMLEGSDQYLYLTNVGTGNAGMYIRGRDATSELRSHSTGMFTWEVTGSEKMRLNSSGTLKIGGNTLVTPSTDADNLVIDTGDVDSGISILSSTTGRIYFGDASNDDTGSIRYVHTDNSMRFETNDEERLRITATGDIGISNSSPSNWGGGVPTIEIKGTASTGSNSTRSGAIAFESGSGNNGYAVLWGQSGGIHIYTGATDRASATYAAQFNSSGNLAFASGNGIDFSANSNAGGMSSELLDDYEEGTYTPTLTNTGASPTYQYQQGRYTKIGRYVIAQGIIGVTNNNTFSGSVSISIPFTGSSAITYGQCGPVADGSGFGGVSNQFGTMVGANATAGTLVIIANNAALLNYSDLANSWYIRFNFMYEAA